MKVVLGKDGLNINGKKFNPNDFSYKNMEIKVEKATKKQDAFSILENMASLKNDNWEETGSEKLRTLQNISKTK